MYKTKWNQFTITLSFLIALHIRHALSTPGNEQSLAFMNHSAKKMGKWVKNVSANMTRRRDSALRWQHRAGHSRPSLHFRTFRLRYAGIWRRAIWYRFECFRTTCSLRFSAHKTNTHNNVLCLFSVSKMWINPYRTNVENRVSS